MIIYDIKYCLENLNHASNLACNLTKYGEPRQQTRNANIRPEESNRIKKIQLESIRTFIPFKTKSKYNKDHRCYF